MKKTTLFKTMLLAAIFMVGSGNVWSAEKTIIITLETSGITESGYNSGAERTWTQNGVDFGAKAVMVASGDNAGSIQAQAANGVLYNTSAIPGTITSITITSTSTARESNCYGGNVRLVNNATAGYDVNGGTQVGAASTAGWTATDFAGTSYSYFAIKRGANAAYWSQIVIKYEEATCISPNIAFSSKDITLTVGDPAPAMLASSDNNVTAIKYSSSDNSFATVDESTGVVTFNTSDPGIVTITATQIEDAGYCLGTATYTITVNPTPKTFELVTSVSELTADAAYLVVGIDTVTDLVYALGAQNANNRAPVLVEVVDNKITTPLAYSSGITWLPNELTLGGSTGVWTLYDPILEKMIGPDKSSSANNHLKPSDNIPTWTIVISDTEANIICVGDEVNTNETNPRNSLRFNRGNMLFSCYTAGTQLPVYLYKETTGPDGINNNKKDNDLKPYSASGRIYFNASEGNTVEIYNVLGQRLYQGITVNGLNSLPANKGIVLVKVGNSASKLIVR
jgi:Bacterial Ig-like domain (group 2).